MNNMDIELWTVVEEVRRCDGHPPMISDVIVFFDEKSARDRATNEKANTSGTDVYVVGPHRLADSIFTLPPNAWHKIRLCEAVLTKVPMSISRQQRWILEEQMISTHLVWKALSDAGHETSEAYFAAKDNARKNYETAVSNFVAATKLTFHSSSLSKATLNPWLFVFLLLNGIRVPTKNATARNNVMIGSYAP